MRRLAYLCRMTDAPSPLGLFVAPVTAFQQNCTVVWCTKTNKAAVIDPGGGVDPILAEIARRGLTLVKIDCTRR